jgi:hypothetical protein
MRPLRCISSNSQRLDIIDELAIPKASSPVQRHASPFSARTLQWLALLALVVSAGVGGLWLLDSPTPGPEVPQLVVPDAGRFALSAPRSTFTAGGAPFPSATLTPTIDRACVSGRVVDSVSGTGIADAQVTLSTFAGTVGMKTDDTGRFEQRGLTEGVVAIIEVTAAGFFPFRPEWGRSPLELRLVQGLCVVDLLLPLVPRVEYEGKVVGPNGAAVASARVTIGTQQTAPDAPLVTDEEGHFRFHAPDGALVVATHPDFSAGVGLVDFRVTTTRWLTVKLGAKTEDAGTALVFVHGVVLDERDAGVGGATLRIARTLSTTEGRWERLETSATTMGDGSFRVDVEPVGPWHVVAFASGQVSTVQETAGEPVVLRLSLGATLTGTVTNDEGRVVTTFSVLVSRRLGPLEREALEPHHVVDPEGHFTVAGLAPGAVEVAVVAPGLAPSTSANVDLEAGMSKHVDVHLGRGAQVSGAVVERTSQRPLAGARISLEQRGDDPMRVQAFARTDERGRFSLQGLPSGRHSLFVVAVEHDARLVSVDLNANVAAGPLMIDLAPVADGGTPQLELVGIGAVLKTAGEVLMIERVIPGGGAAEVGLVAGDSVLRIDGVPASTLGFGGAIERIRGSQDTTVLLEVKHSSGAVELVTTPRRRVAR